MRPCCGSRSRATTAATAGRGLHVFRDGEDKPDGVPAWHWDGDEDRPTLQPSIRAIGPSDRTLWHGYLTAGRLEACE